MNGAFGVGLWVAVCVLACTPGPEARRDNEGPDGESGREPDAKAGRDGESDREPDAKAGRDAERASPHSLDAGNDASRVNVDSSILEAGPGAPDTGVDPVADAGVASPCSSLSDRLVRERAAAFYPAVAGVGVAEGTTVLSDVDGDGDLDVLHIDGSVHDDDRQSYARIQVWPNDGHGALGEPRLFEGPGYHPRREGARAVVTDGGTHFVAFPPTDRGDVIIARNDGEGRFVAWETIATPFDTGFLEAADFDGDGLPDLAGTDALGINVLFQTADGFVAGDSAPVGSPGPLVHLDLEGDGDTDLATIAQGDLVVLRNDGRGVFGVERTACGDDPPCNELRQAADLDGDGDPDLVTGGLHGESGGVLRNEGGAFRPIPFDLESNPYGGGPQASWPLAVGLVPAGPLELAAVRDGSLRIWADQGPAGLRFSREVVTASLQVRYWAAGDLNDDGAEDVVIVGSRYGGFQSESGVTVLLNDGIGELPGQVEIPIASGVPAPMDIDGDGNLDILFVHGGAGADVLINDGSTLVPAGMLTFEGAIYAPLGASGDLDGDDRPDIVLAGGNEDVFSAMQVLHNREGVFIADEARYFHGVDSVGAVALGDLDGDGDADLVAALEDLGVVVFRNDGSGRFDEGLPLEHEGLGDTSFVILVDLDQDADLDLVFDSVSSGTAFNDGDGNFSIAGSTGFGPVWGLASGDLDGDGQAEVVITRGAFNQIGSVAVLRTDGDGGLVAVQEHGLAGVADGLVLVDLDDDLDLDIAVGNNTSDGVTILENVGAMNFQALEPVPVCSGGIHAVRIGDALPRLLVMCDDGIRTIRFRSCAAESP